MLNPTQIFTFAPRQDVRFGSLADICSAKSHVRFAPNSDRKSGPPQIAVSALPPKADVCGANRHVRFGPITDIPEGLINYCIGAAEQRRRQGETEHSGGLRIDD
jgi:hypothetical protein